MQIVKIAAMQNCVTDELDIPGCSIWTISEMTVVYVSRIRFMGFF